MQNLQLSLVTLGLATSLLLGISACQPKSDTPSASAETNTTENNVQTPIVKTPSKPVNVSSSTSAIDAKTCLALSGAMQKVGNESKIEDIYHIQRTLKSCLPTANNAEVLNLLKDYQAMYTRFLGNDEVLNEDDHSSFYTVMSAIDENEKIPATDLKKLPPRIRYLVELVESDTDVEVLYLGEGYYEFNHNLQAMADIFTPYLRQDQKAFIQRLAQDNQGILWFDAGIAISFAEVMARAVFWEAYIARYPNGYEYQDAEQLAETYRYLLFFGSENTQWTDDDSREFYNAEDAKSIRQLAKRPNSILAQDAQALLKFMAISDDERQQLYPVPKSDEEGYEIQDWKKGRYQLEQALSIPSPWQEDNRECFSSIICLDYNAE